MYQEDKYLSYRYFCPNECGRSYKLKTGLSRHVKYECGIEPKFKCAYCKKKFARKSSMTSHKIFVHNIIERDIS